LSGFASFSEKKLKKAASGEAAFEIF